MNLNGYLEEKLDGTGVDVREFGDIIIYLMENGIICRPEKGTHSENDPKIEKEYYDEYARIKEVVSDYLSIIGIGVQHNEEFYTVRLIAPDASFPRDVAIRDTDEGSSLLRLSINKELGASLIVCYLLYDNANKEGSVEDDFTVVVTQQSFMQAFSLYLGINPGEKKGKFIKDDTFKAMKKLRVVNYPRDFFDDTEKVFVIRPLIYDVVMESVIEDIYNDLNKGGDKGEN